MRGVVMCEHSDSGSEGLSNGLANGHAVCRDYLRQLCGRGRRCKYVHPGDRGAACRAQPPFCHDFQNTGCQRASCRFLHCTRHEEELFRQTGCLPPRLQLASQPGFSQASHSKNNSSSCSSSSDSSSINNNYHTTIGMKENNVNQGSNKNSSSSEDVPACRDFLKGECTRGVRCKYRHVHQSSVCDVTARPSLCTRHDVTTADVRLRYTESRIGQCQPPGTGPEDEAWAPYSAYSCLHGAGHPAPSAKRRRLAGDGWRDRDCEGCCGAEVVRPAQDGTEHAAHAVRNGFQFQELEEENGALSRRVEELRRQVSDLTATNEVLLEQNARLRMAKHLPLPLTQPLAPPGLGMSHPVALQAPPLATPLHCSLTLAPPLPSMLTQQIALNSDMASQHAALQSPTQRMARDLQQKQQQQQQQSVVAACAHPQGAGPVPALCPPGPALTPSGTSTAPMSLAHSSLLPTSLPHLTTPMGGASMTVVGGASMTVVGGASMAGVGGTSMTGVGGANMTAMGGASMSGVGGVCMTGMSRSSMTGVGGASLALTPAPPSAPLASYSIMSQDPRCAVPPSTLPR